MSPVQYNVTVQNRGLKHHSYPWILIKEGTDAYNQTDRQTDRQVKCMDRIS